MPRKASRQRSYTRRRRKRVSRVQPSRAQAQTSSPSPEIKITKKMLKSPKIAIKASSIKVISSSPSKDDFVKSILKRNTSRRASTKASQFVQKRRSRKQSRVRFSRRNSIRRFTK
jgi:hypothetical protein